MKFDDSLQKIIQFVPFDQRQQIHCSRYIRQSNGFADLGQRSFVSGKQAQHLHQRLCILCHTCIFQRSDFFFRQLPLFEQWSQHRLFKRISI